MLYNNTIQNKKQNTVLKSIYHSIYGLGTPLATKSSTNPKKCSQVQGVVITLVLGDINSSEQLLACVLLSNTELLPPGWSTGTRRQRLLLAFSLPRSGDTTTLDGWCRPLILIVPLAIAVAMSNTTSNGLNRHAVERSMLAREVDMVAGGW